MNTEYRATAKGRKPTARRTRRQRRPRVGVTSGTQKRKLVKDARLLVARLWPQLAGQSTCLQQACALQLLLTKREYVAVLQAGTAVWQRNATEGYGYEWESRRASVLKPHPDEPDRYVLSTDVHVWLAAVDPEPTLIDPTTGDWPAHAAKAGYDWDPSLKPPGFVWETAGKLAQRKHRPIYEPAPEACLWAMQQAEEDIYPALRKALGVKEEVA